MRFLLISFIFVAISATNWQDCDQERDAQLGPFGEAKFFNATYEDTVIYAVYPEAKKDTKFPLLAFGHGSDGNWDLYKENLKHYASHGFVVVFPLIASPKNENMFLKANDGGSFIVKAIEYATQASKEESSPLHNLIDLDNKVIAGHGMGATASIQASLKLVGDGDSSVKLTVAQHPSLCSPSALPNSANTWTPNDLQTVIQAHPIVLFTATNDDAYLPAPQTAKHEFDCYQYAIDTSKTFKGAVFVQFSEKACSDDGSHRPVSDAGHNCPMKTANGGAPENTWVLTAVKLYGQQGGGYGKCSGYIWGDDFDSLWQCPDVDTSQILPEQVVQDSII